VWSNRLVHAETEATAVQKKGHIVFSS
jgi:hypothetical protein